jgi:hypothetical protein
MPAVSLPTPSVSSFMPSRIILAISCALWRRRSRSKKLVADEPEGKADQDRREDREPRPLCRVSDGRSRHSQKCVRRHFAAHRGTAAAARCGARLKHSFVMRHGQLTEGLCPNDGKISPRAFGRRSGANNAPKTACAGDRGFETDQKTGAILENSRLNDSSKAATRRPLNRGCEKTRVMVGSWRMKAHNWQPSGESRFKSISD